MADAPSTLRAGSETTLDALVRGAAERRPDHVALRASYGDITFAELDAMVDACARALRGLLGGDGGVIAVAAPLHPDFVVAFHGALRSGHVVAPINPALSEEELDHLLRTSGARMVFVTDDMVAAVRRVRRDLPGIVEATLVGPGAVTDANDIRTLDDLIAAYEVRGDRVPPRTADPDDVACVLFTSGTTGPPRGALLTHGNLAVNAAQVAGAHGLDETSVVLNHLPKYHLMHMNSALYAGATQVLCASKDPAEAVRLAESTGATHYYSIPMRLHLLASDPRLSALGVPTLQAVASGGSALRPEASRRLTEHFGVPVFQGYGLAETSPLVLSATPDDPAPGTVGRVVAGTECRIVSAGSGRPLGPGELGEIQVRGPQVMRGYLDPAQHTGIDADGWLATGDIGRLDEQGRLVLVDRVKHVFKCDNQLVSPAALEQVVLRHPDVVDCVVVDLPDPVRGAVPAALVVVPGTPGPAPEVEASVAAFVNARTPDHQHLQHVDIVPFVPRSTNGKVERLDLRAALLRRLARDKTTTTASEGPTVTGTPQKDLSNLVTAVGRFATKGDPKEFERFFLEHVEYMRAQEGFGAHQAVYLSDDPSVYVNFGWWLSKEAFQNVVRSEAFRAHQGIMRQMLAHAEVDVCTNVLRINAEEEAGKREDFGKPLMHILTFRATDTGRFEAAFAAYADYIARLRGFGYADLNKSLQHEGRYSGIAYWWDPAAHERAAQDESWAQLAKLADEITVERVEHVVWNRAAGAEDDAS
ncbi:AMP-binding protein [Streptomyces sp. CA2R101]|uniref:AMP-binding protein n=1 Tax=Streptomyces sp. CA2R101 TaxID=3120152 RepID=UPI003009BB3D